MLAPEALECRLQRQVQRGPDAWHAGQRCRELGRVEGQWDARGRDGCGGGIEQAGLQADRQHAAAHRGCRNRVAVRAQTFGPARDGDQQGGLRRFQRLGRHAEPGERAGPDSLQIAAERRQGKPDVQNALPAITGFELQGARNLDQFGAEGARTRLEQAGGLHRQCRTARDHVAAAQELGGGADEGDGVDTGVVPEAPVLHSDQQIGEQRWCGVNMEPPDAAWRGEKGERSVLAVEDLGADRVKTGEVGREGVIQRRCERGKQEDERWEETKEKTPPSRKGRGSIFSLSPHSVPTTVMRPAACRANTPGRYMSATSAPGSSYVPGVTARTRTASRKSGCSGVSATPAA